MSLSASDSQALLVVAIFALVIIRRAYGGYVGTLVRPAYLAGFTALYVAIFAFGILSSAALLPFYATIADAAVVVVVAYVGVPYIERVVVLEHRADGQWYWKLSPWIPVGYALLFATRILVDLFVLGIDPFVYPTPVVALSPITVGLLTLVDGLFAVSVGLLIARSLGIYRRYRKESRRSTPATPTPPLP